MTDHPMLFNGDMVRALLDGRKTQTRRIIKPQPPKGVTGAGRYSNSRDGLLDEWSWLTGDLTDIDGWDWHTDFKVGKNNGDRIWVRETFTTTQHDKAVYRADATDQYGHRWHEIVPGDPEREVLWKPSIHMPRRASRLTLHIEDARVQRLQGISEEDAIAEGCDPVHMQPGGAYGNPGDGWLDYREGFRRLWESVNGKGSWDANPWVAALTFRVERANIEEAEL